LPRAYCRHIADQQQLGAQRFREIPSAIAAATIFFFDPSGANLALANKGGSDLDFIPDVANAASTATPALLDLGHAHNPFQQSKRLQLLVKETVVALCKNLSKYSWKNLQPHPGGPVSVELSDQNASSSYYIVMVHSSSDDAIGCSRLNTARAMLGDGFFEGNKIVFIELANVAHDRLSRAALASAAVPRLLPLQLPGPNLGARDLAPLHRPAHQALQHAQEASAIIPTQRVATQRATELAHMLRDAQRATNEAEQGDNIALVALAQGKDLVTCHKLVGQVEDLGKVAAKAVADLAQHARLAYDAAVALQQSAAALALIANDSALGPAVALSLQQASIPAFTQSFQLSQAVAHATAQAASLAQITLLSPKKCADTKF
jgi:hypothetical protein